MAYGAEALSDVTLCGVKHSVFYKACSASPQLAMNFATAVTREALSAWNHVGALGQQTALGRIANLLLDLHRRVSARCGRTAPRCICRSTRPILPTPPGSLRCMSAAP